MLPVPARTPREVDFQRLSRSKIRLRPSAEESSPKDARTRDPVSSRGSSRSKWSLDLDPREIDMPLCAQSDHFFFRIYFERVEYFQ